MREPQALNTPTQLHAALGQADLRIYDGTTYLEPPPPGSDDPYVAVPVAPRTRPRTFPEATSWTCRVSSPISRRGCASWLDAQTKGFKPLTEARAAFAAQGVTGDKPVIVY
jgi:thiosulfate/3-mercaptopyruvate sulfurtransferase